MTAEHQTGERLARIEEKLNAIPEMKAMLSEALNRLEARDNTLAQSITTLQISQSTLTQRVERNAEMVKCLVEWQDEVDKVLPMLKDLAGVSWQIKVVTAVGGLLGVALVGFVWAMITGQVTVQFP